MLKIWISTLKTINKGHQKRIINEATYKDQVDRMKLQIENKSKIKFLMEGPGIRPSRDNSQYMAKLNRTQVSTIFKARTRMLDVKNNFRGKHRDNICRGCGESDETQNHVLNECNIIHNNNASKVTQDEIFTNNTEELKNTAQKIKIIMEKIKEWSEARNRGQTTR